jgi:flagellar motor protein MotB
MVRLGLHGDLRSCYGLCMEIDRTQIAKETHQAISGTKSDFIRIAIPACMLVIGLLATVGCQKSQPYVLGSMPNYLRPYSPGAPVVVPDAANPAASTASLAPSATSAPSLPFVSTPAGVSGSAAPTSITSTLGLPSPPASSNNNANNFAYAAQISELERRARLLDENNRQLHSQLAQSQQQVQTYRERSDLMQQQLGDMSAQLQQARLAASRSLPPNTPPASNLANPQLTPPKPLTTDPNPSSTSIAGLPTIPGLSEPSRRSGARLTANTSRGADTPGSLSIEPLRSLGYPVETNGTALRVRIPSDQLFQPGTSQWTASAVSLLERVSGALRSASPGGQLSIDSYTDNALQSGNGLVSADQLTSQQADAIGNYLVSRGGWSQTMVTKRPNGSDMPIMDNQTPAGRAANRRIEFVITQDR